MSGYNPEELRATIRSAIQEGEAHIRQLERASTLLSPLFPLSPDSLLSLPEDQVPILDQFIYRFTKLQDSMASRLLPTLHSLLRADDSPRPFLDILSYLEQLGALSSEDRWLFFRALRNNLAHDYPESSQQTAQTLNTLYENWNELRQMFRIARDYFLSYETE
ncbi:MAG: hypothetical protein EA428_11495 [Spirochaetaceae bacterium]|nr:MAG: hypothetical protein EA428_11495 [Spirochaetaceae bacterium]